MLYICISVDKTYRQTIMRILTENQIAILTEMLMAFTSSKIDDGCMMQHQSILDSNSEILLSDINMELCKTGIGEMGDIRKDVRNLVNAFLLKTGHDIEG